MRWPPSSVNWPFAEQSRRVRCRGHTWHVQEAGSGPCILLIHGAGGATHSWRGLFPALIDTHHVVAVDLPGQGFTRLGSRSRCGLDTMAADLQTLCDHLDARPDLIVGHSAGAAVALRMALGNPVPVVGLNAALGHFKGMAGWLFPAMAKMLALNPLTAPMVAATMRESSVERLLAGTGSAVDDEMLRLYHLLSSDRAHVDGTLAMMAQWRLDPLLDRLAEITSPVTFITGDKDLAVHPSISEEAAAHIPNVEVIPLSGYGHLMHEEAPEAVLDHLRLPGVASRDGAA